MFEERFVKQSGFPEGPECVGVWMNTSILRIHSSWGGKKETALSSRALSANIFVATIICGLFWAHFVFHFQLGAWPFNGPERYRYPHFSAICTRTPKGRLVAVRKFGERGPTHKHSNVSPRCSSACHATRMSS